MDLGDSELKGIHLYYYGLGYPNKLQIYTSVYISSVVPRTVWPLRVTFLSVIIIKQTTEPFISVFVSKDQLKGGRRNRCRC